MKPKKIMWFSAASGIVLGLAFAVWAVAGGIDEATYYAKFHPGNLIGLFVTEAVVAVPVCVVIAYIAGLTIVWFVERKTD